MLFAAHRATAADCLLHPWLTGIPGSSDLPKLPAFVGMVRLSGHTDTSLADADVFSDGDDDGSVSDEDELDPMEVRRRQIEALKAGVDRAFQKTKVPAAPSGPQGSAAPPDPVWDLDEQFDDDASSGEFINAHLLEQGAPPANPAQMSPDDILEIATALFGDGVFLPFDEVRLASRGSV